MKRLSSWSAWRMIIGLMTLAQSALTQSGTLKAAESVIPPVIAPAPSRVVVEPMLSTHWSQWAPFNQSCPVVTNGLSGYGGRAPTGCVPIVMGQVLRFYNWPDSGKGTNTWADTNGVCTGTYSAEWNHPFEWQNMKDRYPAGCSDSAELVGPVANLLFNLGVTAKMDYEPAGSGSDVMVLARSLATNLNYTLGELVQSSNKSYGQTIIHELVSHRPVIMNINTQPSHTVVVDGLAEEGGVNYIHINYGWGGQNDGWYAGFDKPATNMWFGSIIGTFRPNVTTPMVSYSPNFMELTVTNGAIPDQTLSLFASGTNAILYTLSNSHPWVAVSPAEGMASTNGSIHTVRIDAQSLSIGTNSASIAITGSATNLPRTVRIQIYKPSPPAIAQDPAGRKTSNPNNILIETKATPGTNYGPCATADVLSYQWFLNDAPLASKTNSWCYTAGYGIYSCLVTGAGGSVRSKGAEIKPFAPPPVITEQPQGQTILAGEPIVLKLMADSQEPMTFAWYHNGEPIAGANTSTLTITNSAMADAGYYQATVSNEGGVRESEMVEIIVKEPKGSRIKILQISSGKIKFQLENIQSPQITLQTSTNLISWSTLQTFQLSTPSVQVTMPVSTGDKSRYFRLKE